MENTAATLENVLPFPKNLNMNNVTIWNSIARFILKIPKYPQKCAHENDVCSGFVIYGLYYVEADKFLCGNFLQSFFLFVCLFFNPKWVWVLSKAFAASIEMTMWFSLFNFLMWCFTLTDSWILKNSCIPGINSIWSWCMTLLMGWGFRLLAFCWGFCVYVC